MLEKIGKELKKEELAHLNQNFIKPTKYFESKGAKKAQMHTAKKTLIGRQGQSNTTGQITKLLGEFTSISKLGASGQVNLLGAAAAEGRNEEGLATGRVSKSPATSQN